MKESQSKKEVLETLLSDFEGVLQTLTDTQDIEDFILKSRDDTDILTKAKSLIDRALNQILAIKKNFLSSITSFDSDAEGKNENSIFTNTINSDSVTNTDEIDCSKKPVLKLVDINKLVDPNAISKIDKANNVQSESVIILSSSEDEKDLSKSKTNKSKKNDLSTKPKQSSRKEQFSKQADKKNTNNDNNLNNKKNGNTESLTDSDSGSVSNSKPKRALRCREKPKKWGPSRKPQRKEAFVQLSLLDTDSDSDSSIELKSRPRTKNNRKEIAVSGKLENYDYLTDKKFKMDAYVSLLRVPTEKMKLLYLKNKEAFEVKRLTSKFELRKRKKGKEDKEGGNSSDSEAPLAKKLKQGTKKVSQNETVDVTSDSSEDETSKTKNKENPVEIINIAEIVNESSATLPESRSEVDPLADVLNNIGQSDEEQQSSDDLNKNNQQNGDKEGLKDDAKIQEEKLDDTQTKNVEKSDNETITGSEVVPTAENPSDQSDTDKNIEKDKEVEKQSNVVGDSTTEITNNKNTAVSDHESDASKSENDSVKATKSKKTGNKSRSTDGSDSDVKKKKESEVDTDSSDTLTKKKKKQKKENIVNSSDSDEDFGKFVKKKGKSKKELAKKAKRKVIDSGESASNNSEASSDESAKKSSSSEEEKSSKKKKLKRIKRVKESSDEEDEDGKKTRKQIRKVIDKNSLTDATKKAEAEEKERKARILEKQKKYNQIYEGTLKNATVEKVVLDFDEDKGKPLLEVNKELVSKLKPHQASGIQFMWDACFESLDRAKKTKGSGCILAHCMGLGKTLQVIALSHTLLLNYEKTGVKKIMVVCPLNTVLNWKSEFETWIPDNEDYEVFELVSFKQHAEKEFQVKEWNNCGGVLVIGYDMFKNLTNQDNRRIPKKFRNTFYSSMVDPGPDLVVCDEGHLLKNEKTNLSVAMNKIRTLRRIVLTGTPLQNNLKEYFCMVHFVKPSLLGTYKEYLNRFVNPITNGQYTDSTEHDIQVMRRRSHVLHKLLDGVVQRRDYSVLEPYLPPKHEYVLFLSLSETQKKLYQHYMDNFAKRSVDGTNRTSFLFIDFQEFQRICAHPRTLRDKPEKMPKDILDDSEEESAGSLKDFIDDGSSSASTSSSSDGSDDDDGSSKDGSESGKKSKAKKHQQRKRVTRSAVADAAENNEVLELFQPEKPKEWWQEFCDGDELENIKHSTKLCLLFDILRECEQIGDKVLVFSQSLYSLNLIEHFLSKVDDASQSGNSDCVSGYTGSWALGLDYFRIDGSSSCDNRSAWCKSFNSPTNPRARLFLISTKAGGLGINLVAANRVIIFDVSWNPSHDIQSIYRVYRFGQTKPCYIYRFVTHGTMEMKIYERQVTKQAISKRVIDEQQIDRHYNQDDLLELYKFDPNPKDRPIPLVPKDVLLGELLQNHEEKIYKYHEHQTLLENKEDETLNEEERKAAWEEFENEKVIRQTSTATIGNLSIHTIQAALTSIVQKDNPSWNALQIKSILPQLVQELQLQMAAGNFQMYSRIDKEIKAMQASYAQKMREAFFQQQLLGMQMRHNIFSNLNNSNANSGRSPGMMGRENPGRSNTTGINNTPEIIDLNE